MSRTFLLPIIGLWAWVAASAQTPYVYFEILGPDGEQTSVTSINDKGDVAGGTSRFTLIRTSLGEFQPVTFTYQGFTSFVQAWSINNNRQISGSFQDSSGNYYPATGSIEGGLVEIFPPGNPPQANALGINNHGSVIISEVFGVNPLELQAYVRNPNGSFSSLRCDNLKPNGYVFAQGLNDSGTIVGTYLTSDTRLFQAFRKLPGKDCEEFPDKQEFTAINEKGQIVAFTFGVGAFTGTPEDGYTTINFPGATLSSVYGINSYGHIAGNGTDSSNENHGFIAFPVTGSILEGVIPSINFQPRPIGTTSGPIHLTLHNNGSDPIGLLIDSNTPTFQVTSTCPLVFGANAYCDVAVTGTPSIINDNMGKLRIRSSASNGTQTIPMLISGQGANLTAKPTSYTFAVHPVGEMSGPGTIYFHESGSNTVKFSSMQITGTNASDFKITENTCGSAVAGYGTCKVVVQATPSASGNRLAQLVVTSDAPQSPITVPLKVYGRP